MSIHDEYETMRAAVAIARRLGMDKAQLDALLQESRSETQCDPLTAEQTQILADLAWIEAAPTPPPAGKEQP